MSKQVKTPPLPNRPLLVVVTSRFLPDLGGVQTHVAETVQELVELGWQVVIFTGVEPKQTRNQQKPKPFSQWQWSPSNKRQSWSVTVIPLHFDAMPGIGLLQLWWQLLQGLSLFRSATVIHVHDVMWWFLPVRLLLPTAKVVLTMHGWEGKFPIPVKLRILKQLGALLADKVMAIGDFIDQYYGIKSDAVSYGAVSDQVSEQQPVTTTRTAKQRTIVAFVGRLARDTGLLEIIKAIPFLPQFEWHFYGDGPLRESCSQWGTVHGWSETKPWLVDADIIIGSGYLSVWEALLVGKYVIVYADNQLKQSYFAKAPFAAHIKITTNRQQFISAVSTAQKSHSTIHRIQSARALAQEQQWLKITAIYTQWYQEISTTPWWRLMLGRCRHLRINVQQTLLKIAMMYVLLVAGLTVTSSLCLSYSLLAQSQSLSTSITFSLAHHTIDSASWLTARQLAPIEYLRKLCRVVAASNQVQSLIALGLANQEAALANTKTFQTRKTIVQLLDDSSEVIAPFCRYRMRLPLNDTQSENVSEWCQLLPANQTEWQAWRTIAQAVFTEQLELLVVLQNTQELRATGGFMGSYARIRFDEQLVPDYEIGDIYEPDGQFQGHIFAPAGVDEYLSSGKGLRLPDANWFPDFPTSAQTILKYFAYGKRQGIDGVVAVNLPIMEEILRVLGPITLPDYDLVVTADNFAQVARADRQHFFPGSQQKPHFLTALANQIKFKLAAADSSQKIAIAKIVLRALHQQAIQLYMIDEQLQTQLDVLQWSGRQEIPSAVLSAPNLPLYFMLVESNVGINKANQAIQRQVLLDLTPSQLLVQLHIQNHNTPQLTSGTKQEAVNGMGYVNYQRLYVSPSLAVRQITIDGQLVPSWHEQLIETDADVPLNQIGFIMPVPVGEERTALLTLVSSDQDTSINNLLDYSSIYIQKQAGLPPTEYSIQTPDMVLSQTVAGHTLIQLKK